MMIKAPNREQILEKLERSNISSSSQCDSIQRTEVLHSTPQERPQSETEGNTVTNKNIEIDILKNFEVKNLKDLIQQPSIAASTYRNIILTYQTYHDNSDEYINFNLVKTTNEILSNEAKNLDKLEKPSSADFLALYELIVELYITDFCSDDDSENIIKKNNINTMEYWVNNIRLSYNGKRKPLYRMKSNLKKLLINPEKHKKIKKAYSELLKGIPATPDNKLENNITALDAYLFALDLVNKQVKAIIKEDINKHHQLLERCLVEQYSVIEESTTEQIIDIKSVLLKNAMFLACRAHHNYSKSDEQLLNQEEIDQKQALGYLKSLLETINKNKKASISKFGV